MKKICLSIFIIIMYSISLLAQTYPNRPDIPMTDGDGNIYIARWFGQSETEGAYWTISNLWTTRAGDGKSFSQRTVLLNTGKKNSNPAKIENHKFSIMPANNITYYEGTHEPLMLITLSQREYAQKFGLMYTWHQAIVACPKGWHLPTETEWKNLIKAMGGKHIAGGTMRGTSTHLYNSGAKTYQWGKNKLEDKGFNGLPAGHIDGDHVGQELGISSVWWTTSNGLIYGQTHRNNEIQFDTNSFHIAASVRCVKD